MDKKVYFNNNPDSLCLLVKKNLNCFVSCVGKKGEDQLTSRMAGGACW